MPPEIIQNKTKMSMFLNWEKCDIYSLGITILECCILRNINTLEDHETFGIIKFEVSSNLLKKLLPSMVKKEPEERTNIIDLKKNVIDYFCCKNIDLNLNQMITCKHCKKSFEEDYDKFLTSQNLVSLNEERKENFNIEKKYKECIDEREDLKIYCELLHGQ